MLVACVFDVFLLEPSANQYGRRRYMKRIEAEAHMLVLAITKDTRDMITVYVMTDQHVGAVVFMTKDLTRYIRAL
jgi:hypothetical protein